jgi:hypothetical protein
MTAMARDTRRKPAAMAARSQPRKTVSGTTPRLAAKMRQVTRPMSRPSGTPAGGERVAAATTGMY